MRRLVLLGPTNVGKSSLINTFIKKKTSTAGSVENLTNDIVNHYYGDVMLTDTPGITFQDCYSVIDMTSDADLYLLVFDHFIDTAILDKVLRKIARDRLILIINKQDLLRDELSLPNVRTFFVSCKTGFGIAQLKRHIFTDLGPAHNKSNPCVSVLGRSNVGKSTLVNAIIGYERFKTENAIGTTRDIAVEKLDLMDLVDTPGYRKLRSEEIGLLVQKQIEEYVKAKPFAVGVVVLDATEGITAIDKYLIHKVMESSFVMICINKVDLVASVEDMSHWLAKLFPTVEMFKIAARSGAGVAGFLKKLQQKLARLDVKLKTSAANKAINAYPQLSDVKYITQTSPYGFKVFARRELGAARLRFMEKVLLEAMKLKGIRLQFEVCGG